MLLTPTPSKGDIVYVDPADLVANFETDEIYLDIDNDGSNEFRFVYYEREEVSGTFTASSLKFTGLTGGNSLSSIYKYLEGIYIAKLDSGISVGQNSWAPEEHLCIYYSSSNIYGKWYPVTNEKFLGMKFIISGSEHYGWIRASVANYVMGLTLIIHDWAYEDEAGVTIKTGVTETPTPIELVDFTVSQENGSVRLNWQTASETENSGFIIQRKSGEGTWEKIADHISDPTLAGQGTTSETNDYLWLDENVEPGTTYQYRLGDIDHANTIVWHDVLVITVSEEAANMPGEFGLESAFPNPFNPTLTIRYGLTEDAQTSVKILDLQGKTISTLSNKHQKAGSYELQWQAEGVASGMYLVEIVSGEKKDLRKVLLAK